MSADEEQVLTSDNGAESDGAGYDEAGADGASSGGAGTGVEQVLDHLRRTRAFDFTGYKRATLSRRIERRMEQLGIGDHGEYVDHLEVHPDEFEPLFNTILINVTSFFRDPDAWDVLREVAIPELVARKSGDPIRVWSAGSSSGQEAYSTVMLLADALGIDQVKEQVKVYATDVDEEALAQARQATYAGRDLEGLPEDLADRFTTETPAGRVIHEDLRRIVIFGRHDLLQDAPISRVDLLLCRNTLMYFNADVQDQLIRRLHFSLADDGYLLLGKVEMLLARNQFFEAVDAKHRLFRKVTPATLRGRLLAMSDHGGPEMRTQHPDRLVDASFELGADAELILDDNLTVMTVNMRARELLGVPNDVVGHPFQDLEISYRPIELRSAIDEARVALAPVRKSEITRWTPHGEQTYLDITIAPLTVGEEHLGFCLSFIDVTRHRRLQEELEQTHRELEVAYEELQSANEELETTNEELQSTIEELETTNEELQSTNEELETMNEELSSTNEELHAINDELRDRSSEVDQVNAYLESVLTGLRASVVVLDLDLRVRIWNGRSFHTWGLRSEEAEGRSFFGLEIGFPVGALRSSLERTLAGTTDQATLTVEATTRRGRRTRCTAYVSPLIGVRGAIDGAVVIIEEQGVGI